MYETWLYPITKAKYAKGLSTSRDILFVLVRHKIKFKTYLEIGYINTVVCLTTVESLLNARN